MIFSLIKRLIIDFFDLKFDYQELFLGWLKTNCR